MSWLSGDRKSAHPLIVIAALAVAYIALARFGLTLALPPERKATAVWPPSGLALAALWYFGGRAWPGVWLGAFLANVWDYFTASNQATLNVQLWSAAGIASGSTLQAVAGQRLLRRVIGDENPLARASNVFKFVGLAASACVISATAGTFSLVSTGVIASTSATTVWSIWWLGDTTGVITVGSLCFAWLGASRANWRLARAPEAIAMLAATTALSAAVFGLSPSPFTQDTGPRVYLTIPALVWAGFRFGLPGAATAVFIVDALAVAGTAQGLGPFTQGSSVESLMLLQAFMAVVTVTIVAMAAVLNERHLAEQRLRELNTDLGARVEAGIAAVRQTEDRFQAIFHTQFHFIGLLSLDGTLLECNQTALDIVGATRDDIVGAKLWDTPWWAHDSALQERHRESVRIAAAGEQVSFETQYSTADGSLRWAAYSLTPFRNEQGEVIYLIPEGHDITDHKRLLDDLHLQEERFRSAFENAPIGIALVAPEGRWLKVNRSLCELTGYSEDELMQIDFQTITHPDDLHADLEYVQEMLEGSRRTYQMEKRYMHKDGHSVPILLSVSLVRDASGTPLYFVSQIKDITKRKQSEALMKSSLREKELLLKEIHHRVKNNLQIVCSLLELQSDHTDDRRAVEMFKESQGRVRSMALIHERLYRSHDLGRVNFADYVRQLASDLHRSYKVSEDHVALDIRIETPPLPLDIAIPCGLVMNELMSNAFKHGIGGGEGWITVTLRRDGTDNVLTVSDSGAGFPDDFNPQLATSFGLQLVVALAEQLRGQLQIARDSGTAVSVIFPATQTEMEMVA